MKMCRHLLCDQKADFLVTINRAGASKTAPYCTEHLTRATEAIDKTEGATLTNVRPIEKGTTVTNENPGPYPGPPLTANHEIAQLKHQIEGLRLETEGYAVQLENRDKAITGLKESISSRDQQITNLEHDNSQMKATLRNRDARVNSLLTTQDALVSSLHVLADNAEDEGRQDLSEEVDSLLAEHDLKPRRQEYTIEILVPTRLHLHVTARSMNHARTLYEAGDVDWNVADGEVQDDDVRILAISEGSL